MTKTRRHRRVRFAPGPLADQFASADGHPQHEGVTAIQRRSVPSPWPVDLTAHNIRMLEAEIGDICQPSVERLKRRVGLLPPFQRQLEYLTTKNTSSPSAGLPQLQPIFSRTRALKQPNKQPLQTAPAGSSVTGRHVQRSSSAAKPFRQHTDGTRTNDTKTIARDQQKTATGHTQDKACTPETVQLQRQPGCRQCGPDCKQCSDRQITPTSAVADSKIVTQFRRGTRRLPDLKSPKRNVNCDNSQSRRQSSRSKSVKLQ